MVMNLPGVLGEGFGGDRPARPELARLARYVRERGTAILITGPPGTGKSALVREFVSSHLPPRTEVEWVSLEKKPDPVERVERVIQRLRQMSTRLRETRTDNRLIVVLEDAEGLTPKELTRLLGGLFNWKIVFNVIITTQKVGMEIRRAREIYLRPIAGKLYGLREQTAQKKIIELVAPQIITANDALILKLQRQPKDIYKITPRQFEEVIADLLSNMGMDVKLTPATRDGGKDILAYAETEIGKLLCLVEVKQHNEQRPVGVSLVRSLFGTLVDHQATSGMLVTTSRFSPPAQAFQQRHKYQLSLKDYGDVVAWLLKYKS